MGTLLPFEDEDEEKYDNRLILFIIPSSELPVRM